MTESTKQPTSQGERRRARALAAAERLPYAEALRRTRAVRAQAAQSAAVRDELDALPVPERCALCVLEQRYASRPVHCAVEWHSPGPGEDERYLDGYAVAIAVCAECNPELASFGDAIAARVTSMWWVCGAHAEAARGPNVAPRPDDDGTHYGRQRRYRWTTLTARGIDQATRAEAEAERQAEEAFWGGTPQLCRSCPNYSAKAPCCC